jgi:transposase
MKHLLLIGVDISKKTLDLFFKPLELYLKISNNNAGFKEFKQFLQKHLSAQMQVLVVMEHTGQYSLQWELFLQNLGIGFCKVSSLHIKRTLGLIRGKSDRIDAQRIAQFAYRYHDQLTADPITDAELRELKEMITYRDALVKDSQGHQCRLKEYKATHSNCSESPFYKLQHKRLKEVKAAVIQMDQMIKGLIEKNTALLRSSKLLKSVQSIGPVISSVMIAVTGNFTRFTDARKFNCYTGIAPFPYESGSSIKGKTKVSHLANKQIKALLNMAAFNAVQWNEELKAYYLKRVNEGKKPMAVINIIRAKLVARMFAVIKRGTPYQPVAA